MDDSLSIPKGIKTNHIIALPIIRTAQEVVGREVAANIVAVGAINAALGLFSDEVITEAVQRHIPKGTEALNTRALAAGKALAAKKERTRFVQEAV